MMKKIEPNYFEEDFEDTFKKYFQSCEIKIIDSSDIFFEFLGLNYPIGFNRIDWDKLNFQPVRIVEDETFCNEIEKVIDSLLTTTTGIENEEIIPIGDNIEKAYITNWNVFRKVVCAFFEIPQQSYVLLGNRKMCMNYSGFDIELSIGN